MSDEITTNGSKEKNYQIKVQSGGTENVYFFGLIGAWVYFIGRATTTEDRVRGFFKAFAWPAILVYRALEFFQKE